MNPLTDKLAPRDIVIYLDLASNHDWSTLWDRIVEHDDKPLTENEIIESEIKLFEILKQGYKVLALMDDDYPEWIKTSVIKPPIVIYYKGPVETVGNRFIDIEYDRAKGCFLEDY